MLCNLNEFVQLFDGFNQLVQIPFGFALGLAFSQTNITVGWIVFWIVVWELGVYLLFCNTRYYDPIFRISYNCVFLISIMIGQYIYFGKTTFQNFLYPASIPEKNYIGEKLQVMDKFESYLEDFVNKEDIKIKKKKLSDKYVYYLS
jgi:hypothetical protein